MSEPTIRRQMNKTQRRHHYYLVDMMSRLEYDLHSEIANIVGVPQEWQQIAERLDTPEKSKVTIRINQDVLKFFKATGRGYQARMNDVLSAYMHSKLCGLIEDGARYADYVNDTAFKRRPDIGYVEAKRDENSARVRALKKYDTEEDLKIAERKEKARRQNGG